MDYAVARNADVTPEDPTPDYIDGNRAAGIVGSFPPAKFFNQVQNEILNVIEGAGLTPTSANLSQLYEAILELIAEYGGGGGGGGGGPFVPTTRVLTAGEGLSGGGSLGADRTFNLDLSDLTGITALQDADQFGVYDASAAATRKISWAVLLGLIADALDGGDTGIPAYGAVGSYAFHAQSVGSGGPYPAGSVVSGSLFGLTGTWRVHGSSIGVTNPGGETLNWQTTYLLLRIS